MTFIPSDNVLVFSTTAALTAEASASFPEYPPKTVKFDCTKAKLFQEATFFIIIITYLQSKIHQTLMRCRLWMAPTYMNFYHSYTKDD